MTKHNIRLISTRWRETVTAFIPYLGKRQSTRQVRDLQNQAEIAHIYILMSRYDEDNALSVRPDFGPGTTLVQMTEICSSSTIHLIASLSKTPFTLIYIQDDAQVTLGLNALGRLACMADDTRAGLLYADYYLFSHNKFLPSPTIDYQLGSLRDEFNFGPLLFFRTEALLEAEGRIQVDYDDAGFYDLRLKLSERNALLHVSEYLYTCTYLRWFVPSEQKQFAYVNPSYRERQIEMEQACTDHLKAIGAYLDPVFEPVELGPAIGYHTLRTGGERLPTDRDTNAVSGGPHFPVEASVVIPVKDRFRTIRDAIASVFRQETTFPFNLIVVDNHSTDGTAQAIDAIQGHDNLIHLIPERTDLGIGGCWNLATHHPACGKFVVQLDSDDAYAGTNALQTMVEAFYREQCAMVVGTYRLVDFQFEPTIEPGIIDHREWTEQNGRNNALRVNGLGAPRAFYSPLLREIGLPNTSYGEDYAVGLAFCRRFRLGRVYDVIYLCRRWEGNSDHQLDVNRRNANDYYKDSIRTQEVKARMALGKRPEANH